MLWSLLRKILLGEKILVTLECPQLPLILNFVCKIWLANYFGLILLEKTLFIKKGSSKNYLFKLRYCCL